MVPTPPCPPEGLTIREASAALGLSPTSVRGRIKAGELAAQEVPTTQGHEWRVFLDGGQVPTAGEHVATARRGVGDQVPTSGDQLPALTAVAWQPALRLPASAARRKRPPGGGQASHFVLDQAPAAQEA